MNPQGDDHPVPALQQFLSDKSRWRAPRSRLVGGLNNGFEKWFATEWMLWLQHTRGLGVQDVGVEYKARLHDKRPDGRPDEKQVDLWWSAGGAGAGSPWNFVELKVVFNNVNKGKMLASAGWDLGCLSRLDTNYEKPAAASVIVIGAGFVDAGDWSTGLERVARESAVAWASELSGQAHGLRWHAWSIDFSIAKRA